MNVACRNYYKTSREASGFTQEYAAELLEISTRTLSSYENWEVSPSDEIVEKMVVVYKTKLLGWWHLRNTSSLARECLPEIQPPQTIADVYIQIEFSEDDIHEMRADFKKLMNEGFNPENIEQYRKIQEKAKKTAGKLFSISTFEPQLKERTGIEYITA